MSKHQIRNAKQGKAGTGLQAANGYVLLLVIVSGIILAIGAMIISARSFNSLIRSSKQSDGDQAIEIAETGASILVNELNNNFPYLLTTNCQVENNGLSQQLERPTCKGWKNFEFGELGRPDSACSGRSSQPKDIEEQLYAWSANDKGKYRLRNYEFLGDQFQGGTAIIQVQGQRIKTIAGQPTLTASAIVEQEITVAPKCCNKPPFVDLEQCTSGSKKILGLLTKNITPNGGLDVFGDVHTIDSCPPGMVGTPTTNCVNSNSLCEKYLLETKDEITPEMAGQTGQLCNHVSGESTYGYRAFPIAPTWAEAGAAQNAPQNWDSTEAAIINQSIVIGHDNKPSYCLTTTGSDGKKTTHCRIKSINLSGDQSIELKPEDGHISFYLDDGTCTPSINLSGKSIVNKGDPNQFSIIAGPCLEYPGTLWEKSRCYSPWSTKRINISGISDINAFIYASCADVVVSGNPVMINGSIVSRQITANANNVQINVPEGDYGSDICKQFDLDICTDSDPSGEFAALGTNRWRLIQMERTNNE